jgi:hypothetical protein
MHVVGPDRTLVAILDPEDIDGIVKTVQALVGVTGHDVAVR